MKVAVIGLGQFGCQLALALAEDHHEVLVLDEDEKVIDSMKDEVTHAVIGDAEDIKVLDQLDLASMDRVCVTIGEDFAASLLVTGHLQELGVKHIYCRAVNSLHERLLHLMKVDNIIHAEALAARQLAKRMGIRGATRHFALSDDYGIVEMEVPQFLVGMMLAKADLRQRFAINLITVKRGTGDNRKVLGVPAPDFAFAEGDQLVVFGLEQSIKVFSNRKAF